MDESGSRNGRVLPPGFVTAACDIITQGNREVTQGLETLARGCEDHPAYRAKRAPKGCAVCDVLWRIAEGLRKAGVEV